MSGGGISPQPSSVWLDIAGSTGNVPHAARRARADSLAARLISQALARARAVTTPRNTPTAPRAVVSSPACDSATFFVGNVSSRVTEGATASRLLASSSRVCVALGSASSVERRTRTFPRPKPRAPLLSGVSCSGTWCEVLGKPSAGTSRSASVRDRERSRSRGNSAPESSAPRVGRAKEVLHPRKGRRPASAGVPRLLSYGLKLPASAIGATTANSATRLM